ncbi:Beta-1-2C4-mannooligosaccharide phosphorylase [Mariniflexile rhizosphaerae]|uniref:glycoside hydrolase family 130 protein n=2 Tax=unclassified Mariniflexile TaxID=2643887 RepID=UPI000CC69987|nr:Beta-1-2C4-mannooligosaccharide phosphorylase [Mariniflexile sp. TRM1-10]PLB20800.1 MAG: putative glycoside hydrolase [Flavobacteriaceae bacterium FS1-H7996/R]
MPVSVTRKNLYFKPDSSRVLARFFNNGDARTINLVNRIMTLSEAEVKHELEITLKEFVGRHRNISDIYLKHASNYKNIINSIGVDYAKLSLERRLLIGSYSTMEYSIESAALFNPSIIEDFDQTFLEEGEKRVIISFRATGEGHLSSIVFRKGILDASNNLRMVAVHKHIDFPIIKKKKSYNKTRFMKKMEEMNIPKEYSSPIMDALPKRFEYYMLKEAVRNILTLDIDEQRRTALKEMTWLVDSYYDIEFHEDSKISGRVIFPISSSESRGIEDARFVRFTDDDGSEKIYATYTAYDGFTILPKLISTSDFINFRIMPMHGNGAQNKNFALFPRKIKGKYAMLARIDGVNNYLFYSNRITLWNNPIKIQEPKYPWEFTQIGNCGSPIYTDHGWLVITHGVGPMRRYCIGASLLDLEDPTKEIGRLKEPLLSPLEEERDGYVPNVVYSCGSLIHNNHLILPYAVSDYASSYVTVNLDDLLTTLIAES